MSDLFDKLSENIEDLVANISIESKPLWGEMSIVEMLKHLTSGLELSSSYKDVKIVTPEDRLPGFRKFLMTEKLFMKGSPIPEEYKLFKQEDTSEISVLKKRFLEKFRAFKEETESNPDFWSVHPNFGKMDAEYTRQLQWKHITHHFTQFGIIS